MAEWLKVIKVAASVRVRSVRHNPISHARAPDRSAFLALMRHKTGATAAPARQAPPGARPRSAPAAGRPRGAADWSSRRPVGGACRNDRQIARYYLR